MVLWKAKTVGELREALAQFDQDAVITVNGSVPRTWCISAEVPTTDWIREGEEDRGGARSPRHDEKRSLPVDIAVEPGPMAP